MLELKTNNLSSNIITKDVVFLVQFISKEKFDRVVLGA